jgi:hypothetical protein
MGQEQRKYVDKLVQIVSNKKLKHQVTTYKKVTIDLFGNSNLVYLNIRDHISLTLTLQMEYLSSNNPS